MVFNNVLKMLPQKYYLYIFFFLKIVFRPVRLTFLNVTSCVVQRTFKSNTPLAEIHVPLTLA